MIINCDYCGSSIDTKQHNACPFCGAAYNGDHEYQDNLERQEALEELKLKNLKEQQEFQRKQSEIELEKEKIHLEMLKQNQRTVEPPRKKTNPLAKGCLVFLIIVAVIIISFFILCAYIVKLAVEEADNLEKMQPETEITKELETEPEIVEIPVSGGFNEPLSTSTYSVTITELKEASASWPYEPNKGNMYIAVNFVVENITDEEIDANETIICQADGFLMHAFRYSEDVYLSANWLPAGMKTSGYQCFEVPSDSKEFTITYGDYLTFTIENTLNQ